MKASNLCGASQLASGEEFVWVDCNTPPLEVRGLAIHEDGRFWRLDEATMARARVDVAYLAKMASGGRIRFRTDSPRVSVRVELTEAVVMGNMSLNASSGVDVYAAQGSQPGSASYYVGTIGPKSGSVTSYEGTVQVANGFGRLKLSGMTDITLYLPMFNGITHVSVGLEPQSEVEAPTPYTVDAPIAFYGSSITHGACASHAGNSYTAMVARRLDADFRNIGFSGNARGDVEIAEYIASLDLSVFVMDYDYNTPNPEHLHKTHGPFFEIIRAKQPTLPVVFVSGPNPEREIYFEERRAAVRATYEAAVAAGDRHVYFVDGETLFGDTNRNECTADALHPNDLGFLRMADRITPVVKQALDEK